MARLRAIIAAVTAAMMAGGGVAAGGGSAPYRFVVTDARNAVVLHAEPARAGDRFVLAYVHSSEHVPVRGTFVVDADGRFRVAETAFGGFGPGLPELRPGQDTWRVEDGMLVREGGGEPMETLTVRVVPTTRHRLQTPRGDTVDLSARMGAGGPVRLSIEPAP